MKITLHKKKHIPVFGSSELNICLETKSIELMGQLIQMIKKEFDI